jgi:hypothetical protein
MVKVQSTIAAILSGPPLPPAIFIGIAITVKPLAGRALRSAKFSKAGTFLANKTWWLS